LNLLAGKLIRLENPIWHALTTSHKQLSQGDRLARRYNPDFTTLAGLVEPSPDAFASLAEIVEGEARVGLFLLEEPELPSNLSCLRSGPLVQMICDAVIECKSQAMVELSKADVPEMKELAAITQPGPFADRTIEFGTFLGIRDGSRLVAMAGERMNIENLIEVSAVCTHPDYQGRGYARALVYEKARRILESGNLPFLHVMQTNVAGIRTYESIGFKQRRVFHLIVVAPARGDADEHA
jgi:ribosomal protein S18 acetylase RimI-like enzyme